MEQEQLSQRIVNRRRPFQPNLDFRRRYVRFRQDANLNEFLSDSDDLSDFEDTKWWCPCCDPTEDPYLGFKLTEILARVFSPVNPVLGLESSAVKSLAHSGESESQLFENKRGNGKPLEQRLAEYVAQCLDRSGAIDAVRPQVMENTGELRNLDILKAEAARLKAPGLAKLLCFFSPFWLREPKTWKRNSGISLLDHVLVQYDVPPFLTNEWMRQSETESFEIKWLCWFILFAQGGSLKRAATDFNWYIPGKFQHLLRGVPANWHPVKACIFVEVLRLGGSETDFRRVCSDASFMVDPTADSQHSPESVFWRDPAEIDIGFWRETVQWLIANRQAITNTTSQRILSWAMHEYTEAKRALPQQVFSLKGQGVRAVNEKSLEHYNRLRNPHENFVWQRHDLDWTLDDPITGKWSFVELTSSEELFWEGRVMNHCVYTYGEDCSEGDAAIISVKRNNAPCLTIEVEPATWKVIQIKGAFNRAPDLAERKAVNSWVSAVVQPKAPLQEAEPA